MNIITLEETLKDIPEGRAKTSYAQTLAEVSAETVAVHLQRLTHAAWFVPDQRPAQALGRHGVQRWQILTLFELRDWIGAFGTTIATIGEAVEAFRSAPAESIRSMDVANV
jgi:hypothetical protein